VNWTLWLLRLAVTVVSVGVQAVAILPAIITIVMLTHAFPPSWVGAFVVCCIVALGLFEGLLAAGVAWAARIWAAGRTISPVLVAVGGCLGFLGGTGGFLAYLRFATGPPPIREEDMLFFYGAAPLVGSGLGVFLGTLVPRRAATPGATIDRTPEATTP
jgi:hypothetical protein